MIRIGMTVRSIVDPHILLAAKGTNVTGPEKDALRLLAEAHATGAVGG
jgi:hypothetical protein